MPERPDDTLSKRPASVRVIPWDTLGWAVDIDHGNGKHDAIRLGRVRPQKRKRSAYDRAALPGRARRSTDT